MELYLHPSVRLHGVVITLRFCAPKWSNLMMQMWHVFRAVMSFIVVGASLVVGDDKICY
jgi:hypothetical protein